MMLADPATEDHGDRVGLSDRSIGIKQPLPKVVQRRTAMKDQVVAEFARLNQSIQKDAIKATVVPTNAALVVFIEGVHEGPPPSRSQQGNSIIERALRPRGRRDIKGGAL